MKLPGPPGYAQKAAVHCSNPQRPGLPLQHWSRIQGTHPKVDDVSEACELLESSRAGSGASGSVGSWVEPWRDQAQGIPFRDLGPSIAQPSQLLAAPLAGVCACHLQLLLEALAGKLASNSALT